MICTPLIPIDQYWKQLNVLDIRPNVYEISNWGNIRRIEDKYPIKAQKLINKYGAYQIVNLVTIHSSQPKKYLVHRLVGMVFIPNPNNYPQINHIDNNGMNNCDMNLEWVTGSYNTNYQKRINDILLDNKENYEIYKMIESGKSNKEILSCFENKIITDDYIEMIRESYTRNHPISEYDFDNRKVNSSKFSNSTIEFICSLFQSGLDYRNYKEIASRINEDISSENKMDTFRMYCKNLYTRQHHTHISKKYIW